MKKLKFVFNLMLCFALCVGLTACGGTEKNADFFVYYVGSDDISVVPVPYNLKSGADDANAKVDELINNLQSSVSGAKSCVPPISGGVELKDYKIEGTTVTLDFKQGYLKLGQYEEITIRAAIVKTLVQLNEVETVFFTVEDKPLTDANNVAMGGMKAESFADISPDTLSVTKEAKVKLYFASIAGDKLETEDRSLHYKTAVSPERVVIEQLLAGPKDSDKLPVVANGTKLLGITVKEGICYVNFDAGFLRGAPMVDPQVTIYSIVNTLSELPSVSKVQISIDSNSDVKYMEQIPLNQPFMRNLEI